MTRLNRFIPLLLAVAVFGCCQGPADVAVIQTSSGQALSVKVEIADTEAERARGLMFRESVPEGTGMLFIFPEATRSSFWMKDMPVSLDMIFINDGRIVAIIENAVPESEDILTPDADYTMTLEVPGGYAARRGIQVGDAFSFTRRNL